MPKGNILEQAIADTKTIKEAALANAQSLLMESMKENMQDYVNKYLGEEFEQISEKEEVAESGELKEENQMADMKTEDLQEMKEDEDLDVSMDDVDSGDDEDLELDVGEKDEDDEDLDEGLTESDLDEVLNLALQEVTHGDLGEMSKLRVTKPEEHEAGLLDQDMKEDGWEKKEAPGKKDHTVKEAKLTALVKKLAKENVLYKKANDKVQTELRETKLFLAKLFYANKLLQKEGLTNKFKKRVVERLDSAKTIREAKNIFESLTEAISLISESAKKETGKSKKSLTLAETLGSVSDERGVSQVDDSHLLEENTNPYSKEHMKKLAGIL